MAEHRHSDALEDAIHLAQHHLPVMPAQKKNLAARVSPADIIGLVREVAEARTAALADQAGRRTSRARVLDDVDRECREQGATWGERDLVDGTGPETLLPPWFTDVLPGDTAHEVAWMASHAISETPGATEVTLAGVALEQVMAVLAAPGIVDLRAQVVRTAGFLVRWAEAIDRRTAGEV